MRICSVLFVFVSYLLGSGSLLSAQLSVGGVNEGVWAYVTPQSGGRAEQVTSLNTPTTQPIDINNHVVLQGNVAEAVLTKSSSSLFLCVGAFGQPDGTQCQGSMRFRVTNTGPTSVWFSISGFISESSVVTTQRRFDYVNTNTSTLFSTSGLGAFGLSDELAPGATAWLYAEAFNNRNFFSRSSSQVIAHISVLTSPCGSDSITSEAGGMVAGLGGLPPILSYGGCSSAGTVSLDVALANPTSSSALILGLPGPGVPIFGGILWPANPIAVPFVTGSPGTMGFGGWSTPLPIPPGTIGSFSMQALVVDPAAVFGLAFSNALTVTLS